MGRSITNNFKVGVFRCFQNSDPHCILNAQRSTKLENKIECSFNELSTKLQLHLRATLLKPWPKYRLIQFSLLSQISFVMCLLSQFITCLFLHFKNTVSCTFVAKKTFDALVAKMFLLSWRLHRAIFTYPNIRF